VTDKKKSGLIALIGRPNAGKSTLLNALIGEKIAIVSPRPQTTRNRILGILNDPRGQAVFFDLPGVHRPRHAMNTRMMREVRSALDEVDLIGHLIDASETWGGGENFLFDLLEPVPVPVIGILTKIDLLPHREELLPKIEAYSSRRPTSPIVPICAPRGDGIEALLQEIFKGLPEGEAFYGEDLNTLQSEEFFIAELIREKLLERTRNELPYSTGVVVEFLREEGQLLRIDAVIYVERSSQKGIIIGKGGKMLRSIGTAARKELEKLFQTKIFLALHVKVHPRWRDDVRVLRDMDPSAGSVDPS